jgi:hypothetical protein
MDDPSLLIPDAIEPIMAYRAWQYSIQGGRAQLDPLNGPLSSPLMGASPWDGAASDWVTASCTVLPEFHHDVPSEECSCGFYSLKELEFAVDHASILHLMGFSGYGRRVPVVLGRIELSGKVIEHDVGYRAERARIAELIPFSGTEHAAMVLANRLGVGLAPAVEPRSSDEVMRRHLPVLTGGPAPRPAPRRLAPDRDPVWGLTAGIVVVVSLLAAVVLTIAGVWQLSPWVIFVALRHGHRAVEPIARAFGRRRSARSPSSRRRSTAGSRGPSRNA